MSIPTMLMKWKLCAVNQLNITQLLAFNWKELHRLTKCAVSQRKKEGGCFSA